MLTPESTYTAQPAQVDPMNGARTSVITADVQEGARILGMLETADPVKVVKALVAFARTFTPKAHLDPDRLLGFIAWCHERFDKALEEYLHTIRVSPLASK